MHPVLEQLHWLPVSYRIDYKVATIAFKARSTDCPVYLSNIYHHRLRTNERASFVEPTFVIQAVNED